MKVDWLITVSKWIIAIYLSLYVTLHVLIFITPMTANYLIFQNYVNWPFVDLTDPRKFDLPNVHNFYLDTDKDVRVGIWHFIPSPLEYDYERDFNKSLKEHFETYFKNYDKRPIIIYVHGNDRDRSDISRVKLCTSLCKLGYHILAIDVRGYGDSTGVPSENGVVRDVLTLYNFVKSYQNQSRIFFWGHSLGAGITCHVAKVLSEFNSPPVGVFLEAPFKNLSQAAKEYIISPLFLNNPWIIRKGEEALESLNLHFKNDENIVKIKSKIMILHAEDDMLIPQDRSLDLLRVCAKSRPKNYPPVKLVELHKGLGLGHVKIYTHKEIYPLIKQFVESG